MTQLKNGLRALVAVAAALVLIACAVPVSGYSGTDAEPTATPEIVSSYPYTTTTRVKVNLRSGRTTRSTLLKKIPAGAEITVNSVSGSWAAVDYGKFSGYVMTDYIVLKTVKKIKATPTPSPVPTLSPEENAGGYQILQSGSSGQFVTSLQEALIELGYMKGTPDGKFGAGTEKAVIAFQEKNDYPATGIMDANIQAFLYTGTVKNASGEKVSVKTLSPVEGVSMKKGNKGSLVRKLQERLIELGFLKGSASGTYDTDTIGAVRSFQKKNGLTSNGTADANTQKVLYSDSAVSASTTATPKVTATPTPTPTVSIPTGTVQAGDTGDDVKTIQRRLKELGYYKSTIDGKMGANTVKAVKDFQEANGLKIDGKAGPETITIMFTSSVLPKGVTPTPEPTATPTPAPTENADAAWPTLRSGDGGDQVAQLQEALIKLGYMDGKPDGNYGPKTVAAVKAFQGNNGLTKDGTAGPETQKKLFSGDAKAASKATATPSPTPKGSKATATPAPTGGSLKLGSKGTEVKSMQKRLIELGWLSGKADGVFGSLTEKAVTAFQKASKLTADGIAGEKTLSKLNSSSAAKKTDSSTTPAPAVTAAPSGGTTVKPSAAKVQYANWYDKVKAITRKYPYATVYDFSTGISWQIHIFSIGAHADYEPVTANDTARMLKAFGGNTWNPKAVWVIFSDGSIYIGSTHSMPHDVQHNKDNDFAGHSCLHFPRTQEQVEAIGTYATSHQKTIDAGWAATQKMK